MIPDETKAVLAMSEEEQCKWLSHCFTKKYFKSDNWSEWYGICDTLINNSPLSRKMMLEHLAFRLNGGLLNKKKPIEWILAALLAKGDE